MLVRVGIDFTHNFGHSGIGTYNRELVWAMALQDRHVSFDLLTQFRKGKVIANQYPDIVNVHVKEMFPGKMILGKSFRPVVNSFRSLLWKIYSGEYDVIHFADPVYFSPGLHNAIATIHDIIPLYTPDYNDINRRKIKKYRTDAIICNACSVIVPTLFVKNELLKYFPESHGKVHVIYEGSKSVYKNIEVDPLLFQHYGVAPEKPFYLYVGRLERRKNIINILKAYSALPLSVRRNVSLVLVSSGSRQEVDELSRTIKGIDKSGAVHLLQGVPDEHLVHFYNAALALLFISFSEGFGLPLIEAMNCGCPAIISNMSSLPEVAGGSALLVDPFNVEQVSHAMKTMFEDISLRERLIRIGSEVCKRYSWTNAARETLELYRNVKRQNKING
jgi:alpha-1,3-rhamnosyl/mannosyltransferase